MHDGSHDEGRFTFRGSHDRPLDVCYYRPTSHNPDRPALFVLHGAERNARDYVEPWIEEADRVGCLVIAPEFSARNYPRVRRYNLGGVLDDSDRVTDRAEWTYAVIEQLFDHIRVMTGNTRPSYVLYGHSAGAQFAHRALLLGCLTRASRVVAANAGWYTLASFSQRFPYGLDGLDVENHLSNAFGKPLRIVLGEEDTGAGKHLRQTRRANLQGQNRLERGKHAYAVAEEEARRSGSAFAWSLQTVPHAGHESAAIVPAVAGWLLDDESPASHSRVS